MNRNHPNSHPLRLLFGANIFSESRGLDWLQDRGLISDNCVSVDEIHPDDVRSVLTKAKALHFWSEPPWYNPNNNPTTNENNSNQ